jgi:hypothetical protein
MATATYETVLEMAESLAVDERLRLMEELKLKVPVTTPSEAPETAKKHSIMELEGLGKEIWQGIDATKYVRELRAEWD